MSSPLDKQTIETLIDQRATQIAGKMIEDKFNTLMYENFQTPRHVHNGIDSPLVSQEHIIPGKSAIGSVLMQSNQRYTLGLTFNPTQMLFFGVAVGPSGERVQISSAAHFGTSYYFQPESLSTVKKGGEILNVVQGGSWLWTVNGGTTFRSRATEGHLVNIDSDGTTIVARATIPNMSTAGVPATTPPFSRSYGGLNDKGYGKGFVYVDVFLEAGWSINATFIVS